MHLFEIPIRVEDDLSPEEMAEVKKEAFQQAQLPEWDEDTFWDSHTKYSYQPLVFDMTTVGPYQKFDDKHTVVRVGDTAFIMKIEHSTFKRVHEAVNGVKVKTLEDFQFIQ